MAESVCVKCGESCDAENMAGPETCRFCHEKGQFAAFAKECGLAMHPDPSGERYVYWLDGRCAGKKVERAGFMDDLWDALARARGRDDLVIGGGS
jgi:hypothetical protein